MINDKEQNLTSPEQPINEENKTSIPLPVSPKPFSTNKYALIRIVAIFLLISVSGLYFVLSTKSKAPPSNPETKLSNNLFPTEQPTNIMPSPSITLITPKETKSIDTLNPSALIKVAFVRNGNIYLYEDRKEKLIATPQQKTTSNGCFNLVYPFLSPNSKYLTYVEQIGDPSGYGGCTEGILRIVDTTTGVNKPTKYKISYYSYSWNDENQIQLETSQYVNAGSGQGIDPNASQAKFIILEPSTQQEVATETLSYSDRDKGLRGFPLYKTVKKLEFKNDKYYLVGRDNKEVLMFNNSDIRDFRGWSPDGKYAMFISTKQAPENSKAFSEIWYAVNTDNLNEPKKEILVLSGAAGGDFSTGLKWYFNTGFISYCSQYLSFLDGREPVELTNSGGGGCHNEEGFVATSPNGEYAFVKFTDKFELDTKSGEKQVITESTKLSKGRGYPKNLIWINNDYMVIFESAYGGQNAGIENPKIFLFDRKANILKPIVENAYLTTSI